MIVFKEFTFEAAHFLPNVSEHHKCRRMHGHSYHVRVEVDGEVDAHTGMVVDYIKLSEAWGQLFTQLDHHMLNDVPGLSNSTSENLARWIFERIGLPGLYAVEVRETPTAGARYQPRIDRVRADLA